ncbi:MAG: DUF4440 domain-containing protein [Cyclobacteriaceae bacterium]|nr:DUF4440 domain-containing protein [Cyclobacteriaceae bacterium]
MKEKKIQPQCTFNVIQPMYYFIAVIPLFSSCQNTKDNEMTEYEIVQVEKQFYDMTKEKGIPEAFYFFADENAVIKRENDTLITGRENIKLYYQNKNLDGVRIVWTPDFVDVSECGDLAYTYGQYIWEFEDHYQNVKQIKGTYHTVWKKQNDDTWKYVWD